MNVMFWALTLLMLLVAIAAVVYPLLKTRERDAIAYKESNLTINNEKLKELDLDLKEGRIDREFYQAAREELDRELLIDIPQESKDTASDHYMVAAQRHPAVAILITVFIPTMAMLVYLDLGMHAASEDGFVESQQVRAPASEQPSIEEMTKKLQQKIEAEGGSVEEWIMLGRAHKYLGENKLAADAFAVALEQDTENAQLMLEQAEVMALENNRIFSAESRELVMKAFSLEPENPNTLWFAGVAEFQAKNYHQAITHLKKLLPIARTEKDVAKSIIGIIAESRKALIDAGEEMPELEALLGIKPGMVASAPEEASVTTQSTAGSASSVTIKVSVDIDESVRAKFSANDTIFVYAKAAQGPRMPLAVQRLTMSDLPQTVVLDDSMAMVAGMNLSSFSEWVVSARVTKTGSAIAQSGDYIGQKSVDVEQATSLVTLLIDNAVQ